MTDLVLGLLARLEASLRGAESEVARLQQELQEKQKEIDELKAMIEKEPPVA